MRKVTRAVLSMKLVIAQPYLTLKGGAERVLLKIAQHYKAKIYTAEYDRQRTFPEFSDLDVEVVGSSRILRLMPYGRVVQGLSYGSAFYNLRLNDDYDVINAHMAPSHWVRNKNERVLWYCHTPLRDVYDLYNYRLSLKKPYQKPVYMAGSSLVRRIDRSIVRDLEMIVANSSNTKSRIEKYLGRTDAKVLSGGVEYELYKNAGDGKYFIYPSRISPNKRQDYAIRAFSAFKRLMPGYKLLIVGQVSKDKQFQEYYNDVAALARRTRDVRLILDSGEEELRRLYSRATAVLYTPMNEDYGLVPLEAMASGKPIISVNEGGPRDTIRDGKTGYLVDSEAAMADKMRVVASDPALSEELGKNGQAWVRRYYSWKHFFASFDRYLAMVRGM